MQPLAGVLVLDFTTLLPGPLATLLLAEAGAEVIKIERPGGEDMRHYEPRFDGESAMFALLNRGKKSLVLDLKSAADRDKLTPLIERADVLVEQFRPGVMARLGLGYDAVQAINPKLVYCSITGYGQNGPRADEAGHDLNYIGHTGLLALNPGPPDRPVVPPALIADIAGGTLPAVINILLGAAPARPERAGLPSRHRHDRRDVHLRRSRAGVGPCDREHFRAWVARGSPAARRAISFIRPATASSSAARRWSRNSGSRSPPRSGLRRNSSTTAAIPAATRAAVAAIIAGRSADEWRPLFAAADCCVTIMATLEEALHDPHFVERGLFAHQVAGPTGATMPALPVPIDPQFRDDPPRRESGSQAQRMKARWTPSTSIPVKNKKRNTSG